MNLDIYQKLFFTLPNPLFVVSSDEQVLGANKAFLSGICNNQFSDTEIIGKCLDDLPGDLEELVSVYRQYLHNTSLKTTDFLYQDTWFQICVQSLLTELGTVTIFIHTDISEQQNNRLALVETQVLLDELQEVSGLGSWDIDLLTGQANWSLEQYRLLGYNPVADAATLENHIARVHEQDRAMARTAMNKPLNDGSEYRNEFRLVMPNGEIRHVLERGRVVVNTQNQPIRYLGTTLDITDRVVVELKLRESQQELSKILENMQDTYYRTNTRGEITRVSPSVYELLGYHPEELLGKKMIDLYVHPQQRETLFELLQNTGGKVNDFEAPLKHKNGRHIWVSTNVHYIKMEDEILGVEGTTRDITLLKETRQKLMQHQQQLQALVDERTQELESFSYSVSHDLRAPLRSINGFSQALAEEYSHVLDETGRDYLSRVKNATNYMADLIDDLLQLSNVTRQTLEIENVDVSRLANEILEEHTQANPERKVELEIHPNIIIRADLRLIAVAMRNLIDNAWKYTQHRKPSQIVIGYRQDQAEITIYIKDNGAGFDPQFASKLFIPFQRLHSDDEFKGTGIGLAIVARVVNRHFGRIWAESEKDGGSTFYLSFPSTN